MEKQKELKEHIEKLTKPIFNRVLQEHTTNPMRGSKRKIIRLIQPHNFRRYFTFSKDTYNPTKPYSEKNYKSEHHYKNFYGCHIIVRKKSAEVINLWHQKQWRLLEAQSINEINDRINQIKQEMEDTTVNAIKKFISVNGGKTDFKPIKKRETEIGMHGDDYIDKIPPEMIINDTYFKKVYREKVEFLGEESVKSFIQNRAIEDIAPEIANEINNLAKNLIPAIEGLNESIPKLNESINLEIKNKRHHDKVLSSMDKTLKVIRNDLKQKRINQYI